MTTSGEGGCNLYASALTSSNIPLYYPSIIRKITLLVLMRLYPHDGAKSITIIIIITITITIN